MKHCRRRVPSARAAHLEPLDNRYLEVLERHLKSWIDTNPPEIGVHWYSNLEIALRSISWLQILALVEDRLQPDVRAGMWRHLRHAGRHLLADLPYTASTMRNNHLLGDALGLIALGKAFGGKTGQRWASIGYRTRRRTSSRFPMASPPEDWSRQILILMRDRGRLSARHFQLSSKEHHRRVAGWCQELPSRPEEFPGRVLENRHGLKSTRRAPRRNREKPVSPEITKHQLGR